MLRSKVSSIKETTKNFISAAVQKPWQWATALYKKGAKLDVVTIVTSLAALAALGSFLTAYCSYRTQREARNLQIELFLADILPDLELADWEFEPQVPHNDELGELTIGSII